MKRFIGVHAGEIMTGRGETVLKSDTNSACLVIVAYDSTRKIGSLAHAVFMPMNGTNHNGSNHHSKFSSYIRDVSQAIDEMLTEMTLLGANKDEIEIRLVTGENVAHQQGDPHYFEPLNTTVDLIKQKHLRVTSDTAVDVGKGHVSLDVDTGMVSYT